MLCCAELNTQTACKPSEQLHDSEDEEHVWRKVGDAHGLYWTVVRERINPAPRNECLNCLVLMYNLCLLSQRLQLFAVMQGQDWGGKPSALLVLKAGALKGLYRLVRMPTSNIASMISGSKNTCYCTLQKGNSNKTETNWQELTCGMRVCQTCQRPSWTSGGRCRGAQTAGQGSAIAAQQPLDSPCTLPKIMIENLPSKAASKLNPQAKALH